MLLRERVRRKGVVLQRADDQVRVVPAARTAACGAVCAALAMRDEQAVVQLEHTVEARPLEHSCPGARQPLGVQEDRALLEMQDFSEETCFGSLLEDPLANWIVPHLELNGALFEAKLHWIFD